MADKFYKERSAWILARSGRDSGARRRGEILAVKARREDRNMTGAGDNAYNEVATRNVVYRSIMREEGAANQIGWFLWTSIWLFWVVFLFGPAILLGKALYAAWFALMGKLGPIKAGPFLAIAGLFLVFGGLIVGWWVRPTDEVVRIWAIYGLGMVILGLVRAAWLAQAWGWPAVARKKAQAGQKVASVQIKLHGEPEVAQESPKVTVVRPKLGGTA